MKRLMMITIVLATGAAVNLPTYCAAESQQPPATEANSDEALQARIRKLVDQLGDADWNVREAATNELIGIGKPVVPFLGNAKTSSDPEVRTRAERILKAVDAPERVAAPEDTRPMHPMARVMANLRANKKTVTVKEFAVAEAKYKITETAEKGMNNVLVEITTTKDGAETKQVVEADNYTTLARKAPEVAKVIKENEQKAKVQRFGDEDDLEDFNADALQLPPPPKNAGVTFDAISKHGIKLQLVDDGLRVIDIRADSSCDKLGLKNGDFLAKINRQAVFDIADARKMLEALAANQLAELEVLRNGKTLTLKGP